MKNLTELEFIVGGAVVQEAALKRGVNKPVRAVREQQSFHLGWRVQGHRPGAVDLAKKAAEADMDAWSRDRVGKMPRPWDEAWWRINGRFEAVRSKPYEIHAANAGLT
jgi:hypothetical protein